MTKKNKKMVDRVKKEIYIVEALRHGNREMHSYIVGVFDKKHIAQITAKDHCDSRGGKYACVVLKCEPNSTVQPAEIHREISQMEKYSK